MSKPMISPEIYKTANLLINEFGELAPASAFIKADQLRDLGDPSGQDLWLRIAHAVEDILCEDPPNTLVVN